MPPLAELLPPWLPLSVVKRTLLSVGGVLAIWVAARLVRRGLARWITDSAARYRARKLVNVGAVVAAVVFVTFVMVERLTGLGVAVGLIGAAVALALQQPLLSVAGWLALAFGGYYRTGDRVKVGDVTGDVIDISLLRTTIFEVGGTSGGETYSGRVVRVANADVLTQPVYNYSGDFPFLWDTVEVPIRHDSDRAAARELLEAAVRDTVAGHVPDAQATWRGLRRRYLLSEADVDPQVQLVADENWLTYTIRYVVDYRQRGAVKDVLWRRVLDAVDAADEVAIATSSQEITVAPGSEVTMRPAEGGDEDRGGREGSAADGAQSADRSGADPDGPRGRSGGPR